MDVEDWCEMSRIVGDVHTNICRKYLKWYRILEHLPGVNLKWGEFIDEQTYSPEYKQWSFYNTSHPGKLSIVKQYLQNKAWSAKDEYFHLKKFLAYYAPYDISIDPPINLGNYKEKYKLHSRIMHYYVPAIQAAMSIIINRTILGKLESVRLAREFFPSHNIFREILDIVQKHYEVEKLYLKKELNSFDKRLFESLTFIKNELKNHITILPDKLDDNIEEWKKQFNRIKVSPYSKVLDYTRFWKLMKGRFYFYSNAPSCFDSLSLINLELGRLGKWFYVIPFSECWYLLTGKSISNPDIIVYELVPDVLTKEEGDAALEFSKLFFNTEKKQNEKEISKKLVYIFDDFTKGLDKIVCLIKEKTSGFRADI